MFENPTAKQQEDLGFLPDRLAAIPRFLDSYVSGAKLPGYSLLVARQDKTVLHHHSGQSAFEGGFALDDTSIFRIYSMTKPIVSVALMMLYEEGRVMLYDPITKFIPGFANVEVFKDGTAQDYSTEPMRRMITIHDLLTHQSGLTYDFHATHPVDAIYRKHKIFGSRTEDMTLEEFTDMVLKFPLVCHPGQYWVYSISTDIIGRVVEVISGQKLEDFIAERIMQPLAMLDTSFIIPDDKRARLTHNYWREPIGSKEIKLADAPETTVFGPKRKFMSGGGGLLSTLPDYFKFTEMLRLGGTHNGTRLLSAHTVEKMMGNQFANGGTLLERAMPGVMDEVAHYGTGFGLGMSVTTDPNITQATNSMGNVSWGGLAGTYFWIDPIEQMTVILMTQLMPSRVYPIRTQLQQLVYAAIESRAA